ncbi:MAG: RNA polymerase sigma factor, partial [Planctomycetia bacterium]|nr:RNA polymerase sigma factor [Planctomycetia bacterium]
MTGTRPAEILRQLEHSSSPDGELLARFVDSRDASAFAELVRRHGALVLGVCRRVTGHPQDAEDAFQATFLVLAKKASSLRNPALLGNWLYGVAFRVAWRAKRSASRRRAREVPVSTLPEPPAPTQPAMTDLTPILDEELSALPACYREAIVLCDLRGASREEAAIALGIPEGTLSSRLANGRKKLAARLTKRGVSLSLAVLPTSIATAQASVIVPNELITKTCGLVTDFTAGGAVPGPLARLAEGGFTVRKTLMLGTLMVVVVAGAVFAARPGNDPPPSNPPKSPVVAERPTEVPRPEPKLEPDPKPGDKPAFTSTPKLAAGWDFPIHGVGSPVWNSTGTHLAISGFEPTGDLKNPKGLLILLGYPPTKPNTPEPFAVPLGRESHFVGFSPDGNHILTDMREYELLSGYHKLYFRELKKGTSLYDVKWPGGRWLMRTLDPERKRTVEFDGRELHDYAFLADGKTFRTLRYERDAMREPIKLEVVEVDTTTGKMGKSLFKADSTYSAFSPNGKRLSVIDKTFSKMTLYDLDRGAKLFDYNFPGEKPLSHDLILRMVFSQDGRRLVVARA